MWVNGSQLYDLALEKQSMNCGIESWEPKTDRQKILNIFRTGEQSERLELEI